MQEASDKHQSSFAESDWGKHLYWRTSRNRSVCVSMHENASSLDTARTLASCFIPLNDDDRLSGGLSLALLAGKSMTVLQTLRTVTQADSTVAAISVNCMSVQRAEEVFGRITQGLEEAMEGNPRCRPPIICPGAPPSHCWPTQPCKLNQIRQLKQVLCSRGYLSIGSFHNIATCAGAKPLEDVTLDQLVKGFQRMRFKCLKAKGKKKSPPRMVIVILDEMDCLLCRHEDVLSQLFMLPKVGSPGSAHRLHRANWGNPFEGLTSILVLQVIPKSNLILIGISNSIDLTVRALATLERQKFVPELINFPGYTYGQLLDLLQERLQRLPGPVFNPLGLRLCAKKVRPSHPEKRGRTRSKQATERDCRPPNPRSSQNE